MLAAGLAIAASACSFGSASYDGPGPCAEFDRVVILEEVSLVNRKPSPAFEIAPDEQVFVRLTAAPGYNPGALFGDTLPRIGVVPEGVDPAPPVQERADGSTELVASPDYLVPVFEQGFESRLIDQPPGRYSIYSSSARAEVFACQRVD